MNRNHLKINSFVVGIFILSFLLSYAHFPYLEFIAGLALFALPGLNLALAIEQITKKRQGEQRIFLWTLLTSLILTPTIIYGFSAVAKHFGQESITLIGFGLFYIISLLLLLGFSLWKKFPPTEILLKRPVNKSLMYTAGLFLLIMILYFVIYPLIPELDPYLYLVKVRNAMASGQMPVGETRPLFLALIWTLTTLTKISAYWILKVVFPLIYFSLIALAYEIISRQSKNKILSVVLPCTFLAVPVVAMEMLISRPQSVFMLSLPIAAYLLKDLVTDKTQANNYWFLLLLGLSVLGIKFHPFFLILALLVIVSYVIFLWPSIKKYPLESVIVAIAIVVGFYPWAQTSGLVAMSTKFLGIFGYYLKNIHIDLWFIDSYKNVDGVQMGWPGITFLFYYWYNVGLFLAALIIYAIATRAKLIIWKQQWLFGIALLFFFLVAEILPRLGLAYLPDRAWLFVSTLAAFILSAPLLKNLAEKNTKKITVLFTLLFAISILMNFGLVYAKQGWTNNNEVKAAEFIKDKLPANAAYISQSGNYPMLQYFADKKYVVSSQEAFCDNGFIANKSSIKDEVMNESLGVNSDKAKADLEKALQDNLLKLLSAKSVDEANQYFADIVSNKNSLVSLIESSEPQKELSSINDFYIVYSKEKFKNLYGSRDWWKSLNCANFDPTVLDNNPNAQKVYDDSGVYIWRIRS